MLLKTISTFKEAAMRMPFNFAALKNSRANGPYVCLLSIRYSLHMESLNRV